MQWQLRIADGERLTFAQDDVRPRGWAIEARIYAEDPANHMLPSTGTIARWSPPEGPGVRVDAGVTTGSEVSVYYDPMLAKLIVFGTDRAHAIARLDRALEDVRDRRRARERSAAAVDRARRSVSRRRDDDQFSRAAPRRIDLRRDRRRRAKRRCSARPRCCSTATRRGASAASACRSRSRTHGGTVVESSCDATSSPGAWHLSGDAAGDVAARALRR